MTRRESSTALYGHNPEDHLVGLYVLPKGSIRLYRRINGALVSEDQEFFPFFFLSEDRLIEHFPKKHWVKKLSGPNFYQYVCAFMRWSDMWDGVRHILEQYDRLSGRKAESYAELDALYLRADAVGQFLTESGRTLFKGMEFSDLYRMQLDIETYSRQRRFSDPSQPDDRVIVIALSDNRGWEYVIDGRSKSEMEMFRELEEIVSERDPDAIEGHNIINFDVPYILRRCELLKMELKLGRSATPVRTVSSRPGISDREVEYGGYEVPGRHLVDTYHLVQNYDTSKRNLESYGLKYVARYFGFASPDRIYIKGDKISWYWDNDPEIVIRYSLDDVRETRLLSEHLSPTYFYLTQMVPMSYSQVIRSGSAAKIQALMVREYLRQKQSIPRPQEGAQTTGGYTDIFSTGVLGPIVHADVESLYPSIMISRHISPKTDYLDVFHTLLSELTKQRLRRKKEMLRTKEPDMRIRFDAMQSSLKILVNSFYGYLGYSRGLFNDYGRADEVTRAGREILRLLIDQIILHGGSVVEVDTDGLYFVPPDNVVGAGAELELMEHVSKALPSGIVVAVNGRYQKILSYKMKNYALLDYDQRIIIRGSSLIARSMERFARNYLRQCIECLLNGKVEILHQLYVNLYKDISAHRLDVRDFARTENLRDTIDQYERDVASGRRNKSAAYEVAAASYRTFKAGDRVSYYFTGSDTNIKGFENCKLAESWDPNFPDENTPFYLKRLDELSKKFEEFFTPQDFRRIFSVEDLFGFSPKGIELLTREVKEAAVPAEDEPAELSKSEFKIWLAEE